MRIRHLCLLIVLAMLILPATSYAQEIRGVWRTLDASDEEGKQQGGIVFRSDYTGEFISPTLTKSGQNDESLMKLLETVTGGSTNLRFKYTYENSMVSITVTHLGNVPIASSKMTVWLAEISGGNLRLSEQGGGVKWILLTRI